MNPDLGPTSRDWVGELTSLGTYQAAVRQLTADLRDSRRQSADERRAHEAEAAQLTAQLYEGLSPELLELRKQLSYWRDRAAAAELRLRTARRGGAHG